jgi:hypothetical protein
LPQPEQLGSACVGAQLDRKLTYVAHISRNTTVFESVDHWSLIHESQGHVLHETSRGVAILVHFAELVFHFVVELGRQVGLEFGQLFDMGILLFL